MASYDDATAAVSSPPANACFRGDAYTDTVEGYFSILKRGIYGVYQHVSVHHLKRYLAEFNFGYNERVLLGIDDTERTPRALRSIVGKRLYIGTDPQNGPLVPARDD